MTNLLEIEADFAVLEGDHRRAARLYAQSRTHAFHAGTPWPHYRLRQLLAWIVDHAPVRR